LAQRRGAFGGWECEKSKQKKSRGVFGGKQNGGKKSRGFAQTHTHTHTHTDSKYERGGAGCCFVLGERERASESRRGALSLLPLSWRSRAPRLCATAVRSPWFGFRGKGGKKQTK
jgi:hypothetical protein